VIENRPASLAANALYTALPEGVVSVDVSALPEILRLDLDTLSGVQPITESMAKAAGGELRDDPSPGEIALHRENGTAFQLVLVAFNLFALQVVEDRIIGRPYAISLVPASKRGEVQTVTIDWIEKMRLEASPFEGTAYVGFDPFTGDRGLFGDAASFMESGGFKDRHPDEIGFVSGGYLLAPVSEEDPPLLPGAGLKGEKANARYAKFRAKSFYRPFKDDRPRRIWGLDSPIELFVTQGLADRGLFPEMRTLFLGDGSAFPSYYHMLDDPALRTRLDAFTTADFYFPDQRLAVFCDSTQYHSRKAQREKDAKITARLESLGYRVLRIQGSTIVDDLPAALDQIVAALG